MTPEELIAWHAHQITFLPETDNVLVQHHRDAMHCVERLRAEVAAQLGQMMRDVDRAEKAEAEAGRLRELLREFCERVERGEVRSVKTYAKFKAALKEGS